MTPLRFRRLATALVIALVLSSLSSGLMAQEPQEPTFRSESNVVLVPALVRDKQNDVVYGLDARDFLVEDEGTPQQVHLDEAAEFQPVSLVVAVQVGRRANFEFSRMRGLGAAIANLLQGQNQAAVLLFDSQVHPVQGFTSNPDILARRLSGLPQGDGGAAVLDAVDESVKLLNQAPKPRLRALLLISETRDHGSTASVDDVVRALGNSNVVVYTLAFSPGKSNVLDTLRGKNNPDLHPEQTEVHEGPDLLAPIQLVAAAMHKNSAKAMAAISGGEYQQFDSEKQFDLRMNDFANHLHNRYLLSFQPKSPHPGLHQIQVQLKDPENRTVLARTTYWAEKATP